MRRENRRLLEEENNKIFEQLRQEKLKRATAASVAANENSIKSHLSSNNSTVRFKVSWPASESSRFDKKFFQDLFSKYGEVENFVMGAKASGLLEFKSRQDAIKCWKDEKILCDEYLIRIKCLDDLDLNQHEIISHTTLECNHEQTSESFEDLEARILKKMRATKSG